MFGNFHIGKDRVSFSLIEQINGDYLLSNKVAPKVILPNNVYDLENYIKSINNELSFIPNKHLSINVIIDDSQLDDLNVKLVKTTLVQEDINKLDDAYEAMQHLINKNVENEIQNNQIQVVGQNITYEYLLYKSNNQVKIYHEFPKGKKFTKIVAKTSFCYQNNNSNYNKILSLFKALPSQEFNVMLKSQVNSANLKSAANVNFDIEIDDNCTIFKLVYNGAIIKYKKLLVGTDNLIHKIASVQNISIKQAENKVKYIISKTDNTDVAADINLSEVHTFLKMYGDFLEFEMNNFAKEKYINPEKLNTLSFSGELDWVNSYFEKMHFLPQNMGFTAFWKNQHTSLNNKKEYTQEPITLSVMTFLKAFIIKETNTANTISSHFDLKNTKKQRFLLFRELFANRKLV